MRSIAISAMAIFFTSSAPAEDWPQWMGAHRDGVYRETGVLQELPKKGLRYRWKKPIGQGYSGPAVAEGRVYVMDRKPDEPRSKSEKKVADLPKTKDAKDSKESKKAIDPKAKTTVAERCLCLRSDTGELIWERLVDVEYKLSYSEGPRATPLFANGKVYTLGAMGRLECLDAKTGSLIWSRDFQTEFNAPNQAWGWAAHPFIDGDRLITLVGGKNSAVVAFNKNDGKELWRALTSSEVGYAPPLVAEIAGKRQIIVYLSDLLAGLDPATGTQLWSIPYPGEGKPSRPATPIGMPIQFGGKIFVTSFYEGSLLLDLGPTGDKPKIVYRGNNINKTPETTGLHGLMTTPVYSDGCIFGMCAMGELRCLNAATGQRVWQSLDFFGGKQALFGTAFLTPHNNKWFAFTDAGDLAICELSRKGFVQNSRTHLIDAVQPARGRRNAVWSHPAYAERAVFARNQEEIICASIAETN